MFLKTVQVLLLAAVVVFCKDEDDPAGFKEKKERAGYDAFAKLVVARADLSLDPCDSFYDFTCANYESYLRKKYVVLNETESYNSLRESSLTMDLRVHKSLTEMDVEKTAVPSLFKKVKDFYTVCNQLNTEEQVEKSMEDFKQDVYDKFEGHPWLQEAGTNWTSEIDNVYRLDYLHEITAGFQGGLFLQMSTNLDDKKPSTKFLYISVNNYIFASRSSGEQHLTILREFAEYEGFNVTDEQFDSEMQLVKRLNYDADQAECQEACYEFVKLRMKDLYEKTPSLAEQLASEETALTNFSYSIKMYNSDWQFLVKMENKWRKHRRILQTYFLSSMIQTLKSFKSYSSTQTGLDLEKNLCRSLIINNGFFTFAVTRLMADEYGPNKKQMLDLREVIDNIRGEFRFMLSQVGWLDTTARIRAMNKLTRIVPRIAYPLWVLDNDSLEKFHSDIGDYDESSSFYRIIAANFPHVRDKKMKEAGAFALPDINTFEMSPLYVNAFYMRLRNTIAVNMGILQPPMFEFDYPPAAKYGIVGAVIGHEITHGFDAQGVEYNLYGAEERWVGEEIFKGFKEASQCLVDQYSKFCYTDDENSCVHGERTLSENIADLGGMIAAYRAWSHLPDSETDKDYQLKGLEDYNWQQLFFMSYGNAWCSLIEDDDKKNINNYGVHSPGPSRVNGTMQNMHQFASAFDCPLDSKMNPRDKCKVW